MSMNPAFAGRRTLVEEEGEKTGHSRCDSDTVSVLFGDLRRLRKDQGEVAVWKMRGLEGTLGPTLSRLPYSIYTVDVNGVIQKIDKKYSAEASTSSYSCISIRCLKVMEERKADSRSATWKNAKPEQSRTTTFLMH